MEAARSNQRPPRDAFNFVYIILMLHGIGNLMPWNMFINAESYFRNYKLGNTTIDTTPEVALEVDKIRENFLSILSVCAQVPNLIFNGLNLLVHMGSGNMNLRVNVNLVIEAIIFTITIILVYVDSAKWPIAFFYITMVSVVLLNMASGIYQNCIFGIGAKFPGRFTNAILIGSNLSGTFTSTVNLITIWASPAPMQAAIAYFVTALLIILICLISYNLLPMIPFYQHFDERTIKASADQEAAEREHELVERTTGQQQQQAASSSSEQPKHPLEQQREPMLTPSELRTPTPQNDNGESDLRKKWNVFLKVWPHCLNVFLVFYVTIAPFPAILADIQQTGTLFDNKYFVAFACFFTFNIMAFFGNLLSSVTTWPGKNHVWILVVARLLFIPFFLFCNFIPELRKWPVLITNDWIYMTGNALFALSSGYLSSLCMMFTSSDLPPDEAPKAGMLAAFFLTIGIFVGVNSSFILRYIVKIG